MFRLIFTTLCLTISITVLSAQNSMNMTMYANWDNPALPQASGVRYNDCWGYVTESGREIAILGSATQVLFFDITTASNPILLNSFAPGAATIWRDFKSYDKYVYGVADVGSEGLVIWDMSALNQPQSTTISQVYQSNSVFGKAHNIYIDVALGRLYVIGSDTQNEGLHIYDLTTNPANPTLIGSPRLDLAQGAPSYGYVHDAFAEGNTIYCSQGYEGFHIYDISDPTTPVYLGGMLTLGYNHSATKKGNIVVYAEEIGQGLPLGVTNVGNPAAINTIHTFKEPLLAPTHQNPTPHNPFFRGNQLIVSYYEDGVQVWEMNSPTSFTKIAYYDTEPDNTSYNGTTANWGVYPFFPSGAIIASDTDRGLFVLAIGNPFPVEWLGIAAKRTDQGILVDWSTATEIDNRGFEVQRLDASGRHFEKIGFVEGHGTKVTPSQYQFLDPNPHAQNNYYRIKQIDYNGNVDYSDVVSTFWSDNSMSVHPNPVVRGDVIQVRWSTPLESSRSWELHDLRGRLVRSGTLMVDNNDLQISTTDLPAGQYHLSMIGEVPLTIMVVH